MLKCFFFNKENFLNSVTATNGLTKEYLQILKNVKAKNLLKRKNKFYKKFKLMELKKKKRILKLKKYRLWGKRFKRPKKKIFSKKNNYKSRRFIGNFYKYARNYLYQHRFLLKNMMIVKRFMSFSSGRLRKRQYGAFIKKVNKRVVRQTNARLRYLTSHIGILSNALYRVRFAPFFVFKFINQLISKKNIMLNERLATFPNMFVVPGDKLEVVHTFWIKYTRPANFFFHPNPKWKIRGKRGKFFKKWKSFYSSRKYKRRFYSRIFKKRQIIVKKILRAKKRIRWPIKTLFKSPFKRSRFTRAKVVVKRIKYSSISYNATVLRKKKLIKTRAQVIKKGIFKSLKYRYVRLCGLKLYYCIYAIFLILFKKILRRPLLKKIVYLLLRLYYKRLQRRPIRLARRIYDKVRRGTVKYFKIPILRRVTYYPRAWEICMYARSAFLMRPLTYNQIRDRRFRKPFLYTLFKTFHKLRY